MTTFDAKSMARWRSAPTAFLDDVLINPETGKAFVLIDAERAFLRRAFLLGSDGRLKYPELLYAAIKKSGKTGFAAMVMLYVVLLLAGRGGEGIVVANDFEQAASRVFAAIKRIVESSPLLAEAAVITSPKIEFPELGASIIAISSDYASASGSNAHIVCFDELWAYVSERSRRLWDELVPPPTRRIACRLTVTYAGFDGESTLLEGLYKRGLAQRRVGRSLHAGDGILMFWSHAPIAPWQTLAWLRQMRQQLRPNAYLRMIENRFVTSESSFVDMDWYDACVDTTAAPIPADRMLQVWIGVDASVKRDSTAIVAVTWNDQAKRVRLAWHRIFQPSPNEPLDFEHTVEATLIDLSRRFSIQEVRFDPYQMVSSAQRLRAAGVPMVEFAQSVPALTESSTNLYELFKGRGIVLYHDAGLRLAVSRAIAFETSRGWRIAKEKQSHKIDVVVALAMAALGAVQQSGNGAEAWLAHARLLAEQANRPAEPDDLEQEPEAFHLPGNPKIGEPQPAETQSQQPSPTLIDGYFAARAVFEGAGMKPGVPMCNWCGKQPRERLTDGTLSWCGAGCAALWAKRRSERLRARAIAENGGLPLHS